MELIGLFVMLPNIIWIVLSSFNFSLIAGASNAPNFHHWSSPVDVSPGNQRLLMPGNQSTLVRHRCDRDTLLYARGSVYLTRDGFGTAVSPLFIPSHLLQDVDSPLSLGSATFAGHHLVLAVNGVVLIYDLKSELVSQARGIPNDVTITHVVSFQCCYNDTEWCQKQDDAVAAFEGSSARTDFLEYYFSTDAGQTFGARRLRLDFGIKNDVFGATILGSLSAVAFLVVRRDSDHAQFVYDFIEPRAVTVPQPVSLPFHTSGNQTSFVQFTNGLGSLVIWDTKNVYYSAVSGKATVKAVVNSQDLSSSLASKEYVKQVITNNQQDFAVLTSENSLYFGREGLPPVLVKLPLESAPPCPDDSCVVAFTESGSISVLHPADTGGEGIPVDAAELLLLSEVIHVQQRLAKVTPALPQCQHQGFVAAFHDQMYYLDLGQELNLSAKVIPNSWEQISYMVTLSNPDILSVSTSREVLGLQARGVAITNLVAHITLVADTLPNGRKDEARGMSSLRMSVQNPSLMCQHKQQAYVYGHPFLLTTDYKSQVAHIIAGCPPKRNIRVRRTDKDCPNMRDYVYTIDKNAYDPTFLLGSSGVTASVDKTVSYDYSKLGCPIVVYHQDRLKPAIDLYEGDVFMEEMKADYIVNEIHGIFTYSYTQTAQEAGCKSQPQSWLSLLGAQHEPNPATAWTRMNYRSCLEKDSTGLTKPDQMYEILSSRTNNQLAWIQYNSILVFNVSVLNPDYSLCQLRGQFAVQVYGVLPRSTLPPLRIMLATCGSGLAALVAFYFAKRLWPTEVEKDKTEGGENAQDTYM